jgi:hypothetical protein
MIQGTRRRYKIELLEEVVLPSPMHCSGRQFLEWQKTQQGKKPKFEFTVRGDKSFGMAGLWTPWKNPRTNQWKDTFAIVTVEANETMMPVHDRQPAILAPRDSKPSDLIHSRFMSVRQTGSGLSDIDAGIRLRYEITRKISPYVGWAYEGKYGNSAVYSRESGGVASNANFVFGFRVWY